MRHEDKLQILWAISFIISGIIFFLAFYYTPIIGFLAVLGYIILYVGLAVGFLIVFRSLERLNVGVIESLKMKRDEIKEMKESIEKKYLKKRIDEETFRKLSQEYEKKLTELDIKIKNLKKF